MVTIITFIIILGILVLVHELGHFFTARANGINVEEFGLGLPPRAAGMRKINGKREIIFGKSKKAENSSSTIYSINWLPLGGFVKIKGEDGEFENEQDSFGAKKIWQRVVVLASGVTMNVILAMALFTLVFAIGVPTVINQKMIDAGNVSDISIQVIEVLTDSPAKKAGFEVGDDILAVNGVSYTDIDKFSEALALENGKVAVQIKRKGIEKEIEVKPEFLKDAGKIGIGVGLIQSGIVKYPWYKAIGEGIVETGVVTKEILKAIWKATSSLWTKQSPGLDIAGPVGIAVITGQVVNLGIVYILQFAALLSINLAIINILPLPALDGGRILFLVIEKIRGKPIKREIEGWTHNIGLWALILLIVVITVRDVFKLF